ncbi:MAG: O-antigen ligase family protein [Chloroflexota bacterium]
MQTDRSYERSAAQAPGLPGVSLAILFAGLAALAGFFAALAVGQVGALSLLLLPLALLLVGVLLRPEIGILAFALITTTQVSDVAITYYGLPSLAQPLAGLLLVAILIRIVLFHERPTGWMRAGVILAAYAGFWFLSLMHAADFSAAQSTFIDFAKDALGAVILVLLVQNSSSLRAIAWGIIAAGLLMGSISVYQYLTGTFNNIYFGFGGWESQVSGAVSRHRLTGPYANPNAYAQVLVVCVPLALDRLWHERRAWLRLVAGVALGVCVMAIFFTCSRGGFLTLIFALGLVFIQRRPGFLPLILTAALAVALLQFVPNTYLERINSLIEFFPTQNEQLTDQSFRGRLSENKAAWEMFLDNPLLGVGLGNYDVQYQNYSREIGLDNRRDPRSPASLYMEIISEQGLVGSLIFATLMALVLRGVLQARRVFAAIGQHDDHLIASALLISLAGYLFAAIFKNSAYANVFWMLVGACLAALQVALAARQAQQQQRDAAPGRKA